MSTYVRNCLLPDADFASMYNGIELRPPFLDLDFASLVFALPERVKFNEGNPKSLLKKSLRGFYPGELEYGKKAGFDIPYREFMKSIGDERPYSLQAYILKNLLKNEM